MLPAPPVSEGWSYKWQEKWGNEKMDSSDEIAGLGLSLNSIIFMIAFYMLLKSVFK